MRPCVRVALHPEGAGCFLLPLRRSCQTKTPLRRPHEVSRSHWEPSGWDRRLAEVPARTHQGPPGKVAGAKVLIEGFALNDSAASDIDDVGARPQCCRLPRTQHAAHFLGLTHAQDEDVGLSKRLFPILYAKVSRKMELPPVFFGHLSADADELHVEGP
jgi:hypothetical protein